jgi:hypothetical protein
VNTDAASNKAQRSVLISSRARDHETLPLSVATDHTHIDDRTNVGICINNTDMVARLWIRIGAELNKLIVSIRTTQIQKTLVHVRQ